MSDIERNPTLLIVVMVVLAVGLFTMELLLPISVASGVPYVVIVLLSIGLHRQRDIVITATLCTILTLVGLLYSSSGNTEWTVVINYLLAVIAIWVTTILSLRLKRSQEELHERHGHVEDLVKMRTAKLSESEERYRDLMNWAPDAIWRMNKEGIVIYISPAVKLISGYNPDEIVGLPFDKILEKLGTNGSKIKLSESMARRMGGDASESIYEVVCTHKDGSQFEAEIHSAPALNKDGEIEELSGTIANITDRKRAETQLRVSEERFRAEMEGSLDSIFYMEAVLDKSGEVIDFLFTDANEHGIKFVDFTREQLIGSRLCELMPDNITNGLFDRYKKVFVSGISLEEEFEPGVDGVLANWILLQVVPISNGLAIHTRDITETKKAEEELQASSELFENTFNLSNNICAITDMATNKIIDVNPKWLSTFGWAREEAIGRTHLELRIPENVDEPAAIRESINVDDLVSPRKMAVRTKAGEVRTILMDTALIDFKGEQKLFTSSVDITDKEKMEQEQLRMAKLESIGAIAGGIAHDLNNLLTGILGNLSLARLSDEKQQKDGFLNEAEKASEGVKDLTLQLLTFAKGGSPVVDVVDLGSLLRDALTFTLHGSAVTTEIDLSDDLWMVEADAGQINQVVNNLIINAQQAMNDSGTITVSARNIRLESDSFLPLEDGSYVQVSISDQGGGIPEDIREKIFDPFFTTKSTGSGLGLATSHSIMQKHGGHIRVTEQPNIGSRFDFYLPAIVDASMLEKIADKEILIHGEGKILVMDDIDLIRTLNETMLTKLGFVVVTCSEGGEAVEKYAAALETDQPFQAVILDLTIPGGMGGQETIERLLAI